MHPRSRARPPTARPRHIRLRSTQQQQSQQLPSSSQLQTQPQDNTPLQLQSQQRHISSDESPGFSFGGYDPAASNSNSMWMSNTDAQGNTPMTSDDVDEMIMNDNEPDENLWSATRRPTYTDDSIQNVPMSTQMRMSHPHQSSHNFPVSPDQVQQLQHLHHSLSSSQDLEASSSPNDVKDELHELHQAPLGQQAQSRRNPAQGAHGHQLGNPHQVQQPLSPAEQQQQHQFLQQMQISAHGASSQQPLAISSQHQLMVAGSLPSQPTQVLGHQVFALPQTIAGAYRMRQEHDGPLRHPHGSAPPQEQHLYAPMDPHASVGNVDREKYVNLAMSVAESAKLQYRQQLKENQRQKEDQAAASGRPLTAKDKERERSRRESAVTRKRAEVEVNELKEVARRLPELECRVATLQTEVERLTAALAQAQAQARHHQQHHQQHQQQRHQQYQEQQQRPQEQQQQRQQEQQPQQQETQQRQQHHQHQQHPASAAMASAHGSDDVKAEPGLVLSPNTTKTTTVTSRIRQLDLTTDYLK